jgi:hypothetical protein
MNELTNLIKEICKEEGINFEEFKEKILKEKPNNYPTKFSFSEVINGNSNYLISQLKKDIDKPKLRSGAQIRINTLQTLCELMELNNKKLDHLEQLLLNLNKV